MYILFKIKIVFLGFFLLISGLVCIQISEAASNNLSGRILLQVQQHGEAWYVNPDNQKRYFLGRPDDAFALMRELGLGISESNYNNFENNNNKATANLFGKILIRVENNGEAYYVNPLDLKMHYLGRPADAFQVMRELGLGISDVDLNDIKIFSENNGYPVKHNQNKVASIGEPCEVLGSGYCQDNKAYICDGYDPKKGLEWGVMDCGQNQICREEERAIYTTAECNVSTSCHEPNYTMAFILVEKSDDKASSREIEYLNEIKNEFANRFSWATRGLATMDTSYPLKILEMPDTPDKQEILLKFYSENPDDFDFLTIYYTYDGNSVMSHATVQNNIVGIGVPVFDNTDRYDAQSRKGRRLLGINMMKDIEKSLPEYADYYTDDKIELTKILVVNGILHETNHQWGANLSYLDNNGARQYDLLVPKKDGHWSYFLNIGFSALGGRTWINNDNGTYSEKPFITNNNSKETFSELDLYTMGLIPKEAVSPVEIIITDTDRYDIEPGEPVTATVKTVIIDQIIAAEGERYCVEYNDLIK